MRGTAGRIVVPHGVLMDAHPQPLLVPAPVPLLPLPLVVGEGSH